MSIFSETVINHWNEWEIRGLVLLSLSLQVILMAFGSLRKRSSSIWIRFLVWSAYMSADSVATVALGILARNPEGHSKTETPDNSTAPIRSPQSSSGIPYPIASLQLFWAPFLILHLGGPNNITAYSLEDNELWPRHLLTLSVQIGVAFYVFVKSWGDIRLKIIAIPVFIAGIIKYGERTWVLRSSSIKSIRNHLLSDPDPGPDYAEAMRKKNLDEDILPQQELLRQKYSGSQNDSLSQAYYLFNRLKYLFADLILGYYEREDCHFMISRKTSKEAFKLVEIELRFLYDVLYTKAIIMYTRYGLWRRYIGNSSSVLALLIFAISIHQSDYRRVDISITYSLLAGAVAIDYYSLVLLTFSDWTKLRRVSPYMRQHVRIGKRWSRTIGKCNLIKFCLKKESTMWIRVQCIREILEKHLNVDWQDVDAELKELIFQQLKERSENINGLFDINSCKKLLSYRGDFVLDKLKCHERLKWSTVEVEFDHSLLLWHIATQLCYYDDVKRQRESGCSENLDKYSKVSRCLSDYMLYLLVMWPGMLPDGIGEIRYRDTCAEATRFFQQRRGKIGTKVDEACHELYEMETDLLEEVKGDKTKSVLFYGCRLAQQLQSLKAPEQDDWGCKEKWEMINKVWVELLAYAAVHCGWKEHGQQLRRGGELLTHVCTLMAHLGLSEQYQIQKEYFHIREDGWLVQLPEILCHPCLFPCLFPLLFLCLPPYWCLNRIWRCFYPPRRADTLPS